MSYEHDLLQYVDVIQAGAIPTKLIATFFKRLDTHFAQLDAGLDTLYWFQSDNNARLASMATVISRLQKRNKEAMSVIDDLHTPDRRLSVEANASEP